MPAKREYIPLSVPYLTGDEAVQAQECIKSGWVSSAGPWVEKFEQEFTAIIGAEKAVSVTSGTSALHLALIASGVGANDEVLVPTLTFIAPINTVRYVGAWPVFFDCDEFFNIDCNKLKYFVEENCSFDGTRLINKKSGRHVKAIIPVHVFGQTANIEELNKIGQKYRLSIIEDATEALGSIMPGGKRAGTLGDFGCFSFNGNKIVTCGGGGMVVSRDQKALSRIKYLSTQSKDDDVFFVHNEVGYNYRLTSVQSAVGLAQIRRLPEFVEKKREIYSYYEAFLADFEELELLREAPDTRSNYWLNAVVFRKEVDLEGLIKELHDRGIQVRPIWHLNHQQKPYLACEAHKIEKATYYQKRVLNIPSSVGITKDDVKYVSEALKELSRRFLKA